MRIPSSDDADTRPGLGEVPEVVAIPIDDLPVFAAIRCCFNLIRPLTPPEAIANPLVGVRERRRPRETHEEDAGDRRGNKPPCQRTSRGAASSVTSSHIPPLSAGAVFPQPGRINPA